MDCFFCVVGEWRCAPQADFRQYLENGCLFRLFSREQCQFLAGLLLASFSDLMKDYDHWIAFGLLSFLGIKMILECFKDEGEKSFDPSKLSVLLTLSVATSIDALAVGLTFAFISMSVADVFIASGIIAAGLFYLPLQEIF